LADSRYVRVEGMPLLLVYRPGLLPDAKATAQRWRTWCREHGIGEIQLAYVQSFDRVDPRNIGFDAAIEFPPNNATLAPITAQQRLLNPDYQGDVFDWRELVRQVIGQRDPPYPCYPCVNPGWDNEPRRSGRGRVFIHAAPRGYRDWLRHAIAAAKRRVPAQPLVFVNAWNEWAEGAVLEPDTRLGHAWLHATREALQPAPAARTGTRPCAVLHVWYPELLDELAAALRASGIDWRVVITTAFEREADVRQRVAMLKLDAEIEVFENRGRDILPFLHVANRLLDEGVDTVLKLHTKRSTHRQDGELWRRDLLDKLLSPQRAQRIFVAMDSDPKLGLVGAEGHLQPISYYWGANRDTVEYLCTRLGIAQAHVERDRFVAGSMFWARLGGLRPLLDAHLGEDEFEPEQGQVDGTFAHGIERVFALAAAASGFHLNDAATVCGLSPATPPAAYPYATRNS
jgi:lipopolysaccharide biosynthesis protein